MAIKTKLMSHQELVVRFCLEKNELPYAGIFADYGTGKSLIALMMIEIMRLAEKNQFQRVLIIAPQLAIETTWCDEIKKHSDFRFCVLRGTAKAKVNLLQYAVGKVNDPSRYGYNESRSPMLFLLNYEGVKSIHNELSAARFDAIFADECFVKGTLVDTKQGTRSIEDIQIGDSILNVTGNDTVIGVSQKELSKVIKVTFNDKDIYCSENHLFFTDRGWVKVCELKEGDWLYATIYGQQVMRMVQKGIFRENDKEWRNSGVENENTKILWDILFSEMENESEKYKDESIYKRKINKDFRREKDISSVWFSKCIRNFRESRKYESGKAFINKYQKQNINEVTSNESQTDYSRREWKRVNKNATDAFRYVVDAVGRLDNRVCGSVESRRVFEEERVPDLLQDRYCVAGDKVRSGDRWGISFFSEKSRSKEGSSVRGYRVDSIKVYESGSIEFNKISGGKDTIVFYDLQVKNHPSYSVNGVIVHNSTKIKTHDAERTMALYEIGGSIPYRYIMTGFPITEKLSEIYSQVKFLDRGATFGLSYYAFINKYFVRLGQKIVVKKRAIKQIIDLISPFCIRVTNEILKLPPKTYKEIRLDMTDQQRELLLQLNETFRLELGRVKIDTKYIFTLISKSLQICDGFVQHVEYEKDEKGKNTSKIISSELEIIDSNKDEALVETLEEIDTTRNKVVIWCAFLFSVSKLETILKKLGIRTLTLTGATVDSNKVVQMFQRSREYNVLICTQKKAAESVTLTSARYSVYYSNIWSNDARLNSEARIRRKGSEIHKSIMYIDLITKDSVEEKVYQCLRKKKDLINELKTAFLEMKR